MKRIFVAQNTTHMAIKVTLGEAKTQEIKPFPKLMKSSKTGCVVLFLSKNEGTLVFKGNESADVGRYTSNWNDRYFTDYNEPITIQND